MGTVARLPIAKTDAERIMFTAARAMLEAELDELVRGYPKKPGLARQLGWLVYHTHQSRHSDPGFPDLTMVRRERLIFAELKTQKGSTSKAQEEWLEKLQGVSMGAFDVIEVYLWRPIDWLDGTIVRILR